MRRTKLLRPGRSRTQTPRNVTDQAMVLRQAELRKDFVGENSLRLSAEFLFEAFETARPSSRQMLRTRTCWPIGFEAERSNLGGVIYQPAGQSLAIHNLDHPQRVDILGHLPGGGEATPASNLVLEAAIDFVQLGLATEDCGVPFASLVTSETELRVGKGLCCQLSNSHPSDAGDSFALAVIENHANFDGGVGPLQRILVSTLDLMPKNDWLSEAKQAVHSLSKSEDTTDQVLNQLATLLRKMRSPQMATFAGQNALNQPYARLAVLDLSPKGPPDAQYRLQEARRQIELEDWLESLDRFDRQRETDWHKELHGSRALFINDHRPAFPGELALGDQPLDPISAEFISNKNHSIMSRAVHGQLGDAVFDPLARHMIQMELNDRPPPTLEYLWGSWDPERGAFPIRLSCPWPEDLDLQAVWLERIDGSAGQFWLRARDFEQANGVISDNVAPGGPGTVSYRAAWLTELPGSEAYGTWSPSRDVKAPAVPTRIAQYFAKMRGPNALDRVVDDAETLQRRIQRTHKARITTVRIVTQSAAAALTAIISWVWIIPAAIDALDSLIGLF